MKNETLHIRLKAKMRQSLTNINTWMFLTMFILLGFVAPQEAWAARAYDGNEYLYVNISDLGVDSWWGDAGAEIVVYFFNSSDNSNKWSENKYTYSSGGTKAYKVPSGTWNKFIVVRKNPSCNSISWDCDWNQTGDLTLSDDVTKNYVSKIKGTTITWDSHNPSPTITTSAASSITATSATVGGQVNNTENVKEMGIEWTQGKSGKTTTTTSTSAFTKNITGLTESTTYKYKTYVTFYTGTTKYGSEKSFTTPSACPTSVTPGTASGTKTICSGGSATVTLTEYTDDAAIQWQKSTTSSTSGFADINDATNPSYTADNLTQTTYFRAVVTLSKNDCDPITDNSGVVTITVNPLPSAPTFDAIPAQCGSYTLPAEDKNQVNVNWYTAATGGEKITSSVTTTGTYHAEAVDGTCISASRTPVQITINTKPIISISGSEEAVLYEDVTLTATATDGATVKWYEGGVEEATGTTYVVTSATATSKTVTAKAFLNGCESEVASHTVAFSAEDCNSTTTTEQRPVGKIKVMCKKPSWIGSSEKFYCYAWVNNTSTTLLGGWPGTELTQKDGDYYYVVVDANDNDIKIILNDNSEQTVDSEVLFANNVYKISATSTKSGDKYTFTNNTFGSQGTYTEPVEVTVDPEISAPAVKTVSATSVEGSGVVNFTGKIIKTGCAATSSIYYGYQFKKVGEAWPTTGVEASNTPVEGKLIPLTNSSETALHYEFSSGDITLDDGNYVFRAYIINGYNFTNGNYDQGVYYGLDKLVTVSTVKAPVTKATIQLTESDGTPVDNDKKYCVGETAYIMVESDVKYTEISWKSQQGVDIVQTRLMNMYQFVVKGNDNIVVLLSNKHNVTPAESNTIGVYTFADPVLPTVSLNKVSICSNDTVGATVKLTNVAKGQTYQLYQQIDNGNGNFTEQAIGDAKTQEDEVTDKTELVLHTLTNTAATGKYFVKTYTAQCAKDMAATQPFTFTVVDASDVFIVFEPTTATTTPWMPAKFTVNASDKYTLTVPEGVVYNIDGNKVSVKIPLPEGSIGGDEQYENVSFPQGAKTSYTIIANLATSGGVDNPCAAPAEATITLTPYVEPCTEGH